MRVHVRVQALLGVLGKGVGGHGDDIVRNVGQMHRLADEFFRPALQLADLQHSVDQREQMLRRFRQSMS